MDAFCFCVVWWWAVDTCTDAELRKRIMGEFTPIPFGARVQYLPRVTTDRKKTERFAGYVRYGVFFGYARDLVPARAYWVVAYLKLNTFSSIACW